jgi:hypothetical protein
LIERENISYRTVTIVFIAILRVGSCHGIGYSAEASTSAQASKIAMQTKIFRLKLLIFNRFARALF